MATPSSDSLRFYRLLASFPWLSSYRAKFVAVLIAAFALPLFIAWLAIALGAGRMSVLALIVVFTLAAAAGSVAAIWGVLRLLAPLDRTLDILAAYIDGDMPMRLDVPGTDTAAQIARGMTALATRVHAEKEERKTGTERDALTGLWNRAAGRKAAKTYLEDALHRGRAVRMLVTDIDRFAELNASHGPIACDLVLKTYATRLARAAGDESVAIRWDGDRFVLIQSAFDATFPEIDDVVARAIIIKGQDAPVMMSVGASEADENSTPKEASFDALLGRAEAALRASRSTGPGPAATG
jgi:diguanylate cyclase (GGDEF)-like protein